MTNLNRDQAVLDAIKQARDIAICAVGDKLGQHSVLQAIEVFNLRADVTAKDAEITRLKTVVSELRAKLAQLEPDTPSL